MTKSLLGFAPNYITTDGLEKLKAECHELLRIERPKVVSAVAYAAELGDRSENADYIYGKKRLREIDKRVQYLTKKIDRAQVVDPKTLSGDKVLFGATVTIEDEDGESKTYKIVGEDEIDISKGHLSWKSPVAKALMGKSLDDEILIKRPSGEAWVTITEIQFK